jgi:hypothetical protein
MDSSNVVLDFLNRDCRNDRHLNCRFRWQGLCVEAICNCSCHKEKNAKIVVSYSRGIALDLDGDESAI